MYCYIITLPGSEDRLDATLAALRDYDWLYPFAWAGVRGRVTDPMPYGADPRYPGRLGCMLSHMAVWTDIERDGRPGYRLVLEDDAHPHNLELIREAKSGYDMIFCNDRAFMPRHKQAIHGLGTDGYLVSLAGARRLRRLFYRDGFADHVDCRLREYIAKGELATALAGPITRHDNAARGPRLAIDAEGQQ